jgi:hypothetical protein
METDWWPYEFRWVPMEDLIIERFDGTIGFQRWASEPFIQSGIENFRGRRFEPLTLAAVPFRVVGGRWIEIEERPPKEPRIKFSIIDGGHREAMAEGTDKTAVPACVLRDFLTYEERAMVFHDLNVVRRRLGVMDGMRARQQGRDEQMLGLLALLERHHFYLTGFRPDELNGQRSLSAAGALNRAYKDNPAALDVALYVLEAWRDLKYVKVQRVVIQALCAIARHDEFDPERLRGIFAGIGPEALLRDAREHAAHKQGTLSKAVMKETVLAHYNRGLRTRRIDADDV